MARKNGRGRKRNKGVSRREFIKQSASAGTATVAGLTAMKSSAVAAGRAARTDVPEDAPGLVGRPVQNGRKKPIVDRHAVLFAVGDTLIPSAPGDPGYRDLEWYGITNEVDRRLEGVTDDDLAFFNQASLSRFGKMFAQLSEAQRADYLNAIIQSDGFEDKKVQERLNGIYASVREMVFLVYYQNFPQHHWPLDARRVPLLKSGDEHQITNPNTPEMVTGWDQAGYAGPLTWEEEERRRNFFKNIRWEE
jgi:hypothetical protein